MKLRACIERITGATRHHYATLQDGSVGRGDAIPSPAWVQIESIDGSFYLTRYAASGACLTDTWHQTLEEAKAQAAFEFGLAETDWGDSVQRAE